MSEKANRRSTPRYLPTPAEIAEGCRRLQETWDDDQFFKRANWHVTNTMPTDDPRIGWTAPVYSIKDFAS